jgi:hypothetical protein
MVVDHLEYYRKSGCATKKKISGCIFAEKLVWGRERKEGEKR